MLFLQILGTAFLIIILLIAFFVFRFYRKIKHAVSGLGGDFITLLGILPPIQLQLEQSSGDDWINLERRQCDEQQLRQLGFDHAGYFHSYIGDGEAFISLWGNTAKGISIALMEARSDAGDSEPISAYAADVFIYFSDDSSLTISNNKDGGSLPRPDAHRFVYSDGDDIKALLGVIKSELPSNKKVKAIRDVEHLFRDMFELASEYLWQEQQLRSEKLQQMIEPLGIELDDELVAQLLDHARTELSELTSSRIRRRISQQASMTAAKWEQIRDRLVVVHDRMQGCELVECLAEILGHLSDDEEQRLEEISELEGIEQPLRLFQQKLLELQGTRSVKRIASTELPVAAHVYLAGS